MGQKPTEEYIIQAYGILYQLAATHKKFNRMKHISRTCKQKKKKYKSLRTLDTGNIVLKQENVF